MKPIFIASVIAILGFSLVACGSDSADPEAVVEPPAPTSTATPPEKPTNLNEDHVGSAGEFIYYWLEVQNYASQTGDIDELRRISGPDCLGCNVLLGSLEETYGQGGFIQDNLWTLGPLEVSLEDGGFFATGMIEASAGVVKDSKNGEPKHVDSMNSIGNFWVSRIDGGWVMADMTVESAE